MTVRVAGERIRARAELARLRALLDALEHDIEARFSPGIATAQAVTTSANSLAMSVAKLDGYLHVEYDSLPLAPGEPVVFETPEGETRCGVYMNAEPSNSVRVRDVDRNLFVVPRPLVHRAGG